MVAFMLKYLVAILEPTSNILSANRPGSLHIRALRPQARGSGLRNRMWVNRSDLTSIVKSDVSIPVTCSQNQILATLEPGPEPDADIAQSKQNIKWRRRSKVYTRIQKRVARSSQNRFRKIMGHLRTFEENRPAQCKRKS